MTIPTVAEFFAQFAEHGHIFPAPGLRVRLSEGGKEARLWVIAPSYLDYLFPVLSGAGGDGTAWGLKGLHWNETLMDITAILDDTGNVVAGEK